MAKTINKKLKSVTSIANLILALLVSCSPIIATLLNILGLHVNVLVVFLIFGILYLNLIPFMVIPAILKKNFIKKCKRRLKQIPVIITLVLYFWIMLSTFINSALNIYLIYYLIYVLIAVCILFLDEKYDTLVQNSLIITMAICCIQGFIDPYNNFMPGFSIGYMGMSLHFQNPNYAGYVISMIAILNIWILCKTYKKYQLIISSIAYVCFAIYLFMNGSFVPISGLFLITLLLIIYEWILSKRCPWKFLYCFLGLIPFIFAVDLIPNINDYRTCKYNYFLEFVAFIDNILGTKILRIFGIDSIAGSDGWDRDSLQREALMAILSDAKIFFFGNGAGALYDYRPHNTILSTWLEFGIVVPVCYYTLCIYLLIKMFKANQNKQFSGYIAAILGFLIMLMSGSLIQYSFTYYLIILMLAFKKTNAHEKEERKNQKHINFSEQVHNKNFIEDSPIEHQESVNIPQK